MTYYSIYCDTIITLINYKLFKSKKVLTHEILTVDGAVHYYLVNYPCYFKKLDIYYSM